MAAINTLTQKQLREERVYSSSTFLVIVHHWRKSGQEPGGRNWIRSHGGALLNGLLPTTWTICFLYNPRPPARNGTAHNVFLCQWLIKKMAHWLVYRSSNGGISSAEIPSSWSCVRLTKNWPAAQRPFCVAQEQSVVVTTQSCYGHSKENRYHGCAGTTAQLPLGIEGDGIWTGYLEERKSIMFINQSSGRGDLSRGPTNPVKSALLSFCLIVPGWICQWTESERSRCLHGGCFELD